jgi:B12 binding domain
MRRVVFVELPVWERITPLVSGYLQAFALTDPVLRAGWEFRYYTGSIKTPAEQVAGELAALAGDVYGFSCYVWNIGLVRRVARLVRAAVPGARLMFGGPQVMHQAVRYLDQADDLAAVCNGEGEVTFAEYLRELCEPVPDLSKVAGLSFYSGGELVTTAERPRIKELDSVPSPFLSGLIEPRYSMSILETNRGCPYHCGFCYWGAATNDRVYRFDEDRVRAEITWLASHDVMCLYIADANWGMLGRDVELSQHIADCTRRYQTPSMVYFSAAKNKPHAVTKITSIFQDAGVVTSQPVSLQSIEPRVLDLVARSNIKLSAFAAVQEDLRAKGLSSYIELIWPLPGETLDSFRAGISTLCDNDAQTVIVYSHLLLNNTPIYHQSERLGLVTRPAGGDVAEARIVIATEQASEADFAEGMRYFYAVHGLHNTRRLAATARYLARSGIASYQDLFTGLAASWRNAPAGDPVAEYVERSIATADYYDTNNYGLFIHTVLHAERSRFTAQVAGFAAAQPWWQDPRARLRAEIDLLNWPYVYSNSPQDPLDYPFEFLRIRDRGRRHYTVEVPAEHLGVLAANVRVEGATPALAGQAVLIQVDHKRQQYPYMPTQTLDHNAGYCHGMIDKIESIMPIWRILGQ